MTLNGRCVFLKIVCCSTYKIKYCTLQVCCSTYKIKYCTLQVLDLGSGKGYLSECLSLQYRLRVIGIDSSPGNTENAKKRNAKVQRMWPGLQSKAELLHCTSGHGTHCKVSSADTQAQSKATDTGGASNIPSVHCCSKDEGERTVVKHFEQKDKVPKHTQKEDVRYSFACSDFKKDTSTEPALESGLHTLNLHRNNMKERNRDESANSLCDQYCANCSRLRLENQVTNLHGSYCDNCQTDSEQVCCKGTVDATNRNCMCHTDKSTLDSCKTDGKLSRRDVKSFEPVTGFVNSCSITSGEVASMLRGLQESDSDPQQVHVEKLLLIYSWCACL